jgi:hypothetical protein
VNPRFAAILACGMVFTTVVFFWRSQANPTEPELAFQPRLETFALPEGVRFTLRAPNARRFPAGVRVTLTLETPAGPVQVRRVTSASNTLTLEVPYRRAGVAPFSVQVGSNTALITGEVRRTARAAISPLELNVGARAVRVGDARAPAVVLHPLDAQGNVSDEAMLVQAQRPDGSRFQRTITARHLVAWTFVPPGTRTGRLRIAAQSERTKARGERAEVDVQPGVVAKARFVAAPSAVAIGTREPVELRFAEARDAFGNAAVDGTVVEFGSTSGAWQLFAARPLVRAEATLELTPDLPGGTYPLTARADATRADPRAVRVLETRFQSWQVRLQGRELRVSAPVDAVGAWLDDGTPVTVLVVTDQERLETRLALEGGGLRWRLPPLEGRLQRVTVRVAGQTRVLEGNGLVLTLPRR